MRIRAATGDAGAAPVAAAAAVRRARRRIRSKPHRARGFTLIEIVAVVMLIALATTLIAVSVGEGLSGARIRAAGKDLVGALRYTRGQAIVKREQQVLTVNVDERTYAAPGREPVELPRELTMRLLTTRQELLDDGVGQIRFYPDGSSTGGRITLERGDAQWQIDVLWLTGDVKLRDASELQ